jgi:hypothetical protein
MRIVTLNHDLADLQSRPRKHLLCPALADATPVPVSATSIPFDTAFFYGFKAVPTTGATPTNNTGSVFLGETDASGTYCVDEVPAGGVLSVKASMGTKLDLSKFYFTGANAGDRLFVKYQ